MKINLDSSLYSKLSGSILKKITLVSLLVNLCGCSLTNLPKDVKKSINQIESNIDDSNLKLDDAKNIINDRYIVHKNTGYFGNQTISQNDADFLPPEFSNEIQIDRQFINLRSIATDLSELTHIPTILDMVDTTSGDCVDIRITQQDGNLVDLLNMITAKCDLGWTYKAGKIILSETETKTWVVKGIPGDIQVQSEINNSSGLQSQSGAASGSGQSQAQSNQNATQNTVFSLQNSLWSNLFDTVKSILSRSGKLSISPATSSVTVTDRPSVLLRVDNYMKTQNSIMSRQVQIDVQVLNVDVDSSDNYGINWGLIFNGGNTKFSINGQTLVPNESGGGQKFSDTPIFVPNNTTQAFTFRVGEVGSFAGSNVIINALSSIAKTSLVTTAAVTTLSNQPVPVQFVDQRAYLSSVTTTVSGSSGTSQTSVSPGQLSTGFSLNVLPVIQSDGRVFLQLSLNISALKNMAQFAANGVALELPETVQRNFMQKAVVRSGDTFVVTGFDSDSQELTNIGVGGAYNWLFGGGVKAGKIRSKMVILVTPRVVNI